MKISFQFLSYCSEFQKILIQRFELAKNYNIATRNTKFPDYDMLLHIYKSFENGFYFD